MAARPKRSKKRSAASSEPPEPPLTVFVDECLGSRAVPEALTKAGLNVVLHSQMFEAGTPDPEWLAALAAHPDWLVFTKDRAIQRRPLERQAFEKAGLRVFALTSANLTGEAQAGAFVNALKKIRKLAKHPAPFIAKVTVSGGVQILKPS